MKKSTAKLLWLTLVTTSTPAASTVEPIAGTVASVWLRPSQLPGGTPFHTNSGETFWGNASQLEHWYKVREQDAKLLLDSLGHHRNASTLLYFEHYLADDCAWGPDPLERFVEAALFWSNRGVRPIAFFGAPEFHGHGNLTHDVSLAIEPIYFFIVYPGRFHSIMKAFGVASFTRFKTQVVRDQAAAEYLHSNIAKAMGALPSSVRHASVYWLGGSYLCKNVRGRHTKCSEEQITKVIRGMKSAVENSGATFLLHVDGPFCNTFFFSSPVWLLLLTLSPT